MASPILTPFAFRYPNQLSFDSIERSICCIAGRYFGGATKVWSPSSRIAASRANFIECFLIGKPKWSYLELEHPKHTEAQHADYDMGFDAALAEMKRRSYP